MEDFKVFALDDDGNRIEPQQTEQEPSVEQEAKPEVESQQTETVDAVQQEEQGQIENEGSLQEQVEEQVDVQEEKVLEPEPEQDDNWFLSKLKERYEVELNSVDDLKNVLTNTEEKQSLPEDVEKYLEFRKETGRSFSDFAELQKDWSAVSDEQVIREYYKQTKPHLDPEDIEHILGEQFSYDSELDDDKEVRAKKIAYKEALYEARNHFEGLKERYKAPLESSAADIPENYREAFSFYNEYKQQAEQATKLQEEQAGFFSQKTNEFFSNDFKGFEFNVGDKKQVVKPTDVSKTKQVQSDLNNFLSSHIDDKGFLKDPAAYHRAIYAAMNADSIAKHFYEQGKADATGDIVKETKNIDMDVRQNSVTETGGTKFRVVDSGDQFEFKIRKRN